jgi:RNA polymerase sigma factor (sigma-70 family)
MTRVRDRTALRHLRTLLNGGAVGAHADGPLLERFAAGADAEAELAFAMLVERHGPTVLRVCRSVLADRDAAEDAFQATFLVLIRKASAIRVRDSLGPWLVGVAYRTAASARAASARRTVIEHDAARRESRPPSDPERQELEQAVRDEVDRLPTLYRRPVQLCYFGGLTHEQAARQLACPVGTIRSRLASARQRLHARLTRRGLAPAAGIAILLSASTLRAAVPATLLRSTLRLVRGDGGVFSASVTAQALGFSRAMLMLKLKWVAATLLVAGIVAAGGGVLGQQEAGAPGQDTAARKGQSQRIEGQLARPEIGEAPVVSATRSSDHGRELEMLIQAVRKEEEAGNYNVAFLMTREMQETVRIWGADLHRQAETKPKPSSSRLDPSRKLISKADVDRAAVPYPDTKTLEKPPAADWKAIAETLSRRSGDPEFRRKRERLIEAKREKEEQIKKRRETISALQAKHGAADIRDLQNRNTITIDAYARFSEQLTQIEIEIEKVKARISQLQLEKAGASPQDDPRVMKRMVTDLFYKDPKVAAQVEKQEKARSQIEKLKRNIRDPLAPALTTSRKDLRDATAQLDRLWEQMEPVLVEQIRKGFARADLPDNPLKEAESRLAELKAQEAKITDKLNTVKIKHKAEGANSLALQFAQLDLVRDQSFLGEINRSLAQLDAEDGDRIRQSQLDTQKVLVGNKLIEERRRREGLGAPILDSDKRTKAILSVLNERLPLPFPEGAPLQDVLKYIKSNTQNETIELPAGVPIYVDPIGLQEAGKNLDSQIKIIVWHVPLKESLRLALDQLGLTYHVKDGLLTITSAPKTDPPKP